MTNENKPNDNADFIQEFNAIVESANDESKFNHDRYFRFAFADTGRMAELLKLSAKKNPSLKAFLNTIDISSNFPSTTITCSRNTTRMSPW